MDLETSPEEAGQEHEHDTGQEVVSSIPQDPPAWDYCEIVYHPGPGAPTYSAQANGLEGAYTAAVSRSVSVPRHHEDPAVTHSPAVAELAQQLQANGWELSAVRGPYWFSHRFRRAAELRAADTQAMQRPPSVSTPLPMLGSTASRTLSGIAPIARSWMISHLAGGDEEAYDKAADAVKHAARAVSDIAAASVARATAPQAPADESVIAPESTANFTLLPSSTLNVVDVRPPDQAASAAPVVSSADADRSIVDGADATSRRADQSRPHYDVRAGLKAGARVLAADHAAHLSHRRVNQDGDAYLDKAAGQRVEALSNAVIQRLRTLFTVVVEMIPLPGSLYGPGDVITAVEAFVGRTIDGLHLSLAERIMYVGASAIPAVPARPIITVYRRVEPWLRGDTISGWAFLMTQLPPWLRHELPGPFDPRSPYPRQKPIQALRELVSFVWLPIVLYLGAVVVKVTELVTSSLWQAVRNLDFQALGGIVNLNALEKAFLLNDLHALAPGVPVIPWVPIGGFLLIIGLLVIATIARNDWLRERVALAIREHLPQAHNAAVDRIGATLLAEGVPMIGKLTQSILHLHEATLKTAKSIAGDLLGKELAHLAISAGLALAAFVVGVVLALGGVV